MSSVKSERRQKIKWRVRKKVSGTPERPRLSVFRSNTGIYAQLIDDIAGKTLVAASSLELGFKSLNIDNSKQVGTSLAKKATELGLNACVFDRSGYLYHGNIKALAEGAREAGLNF
ncbi:50S ribosomal protein L18 [Lacihabitans sp. LS3-19]|uniref:50S ribosomal protein L18 n=1 Tax=Lacihabitans sp. LS3-19 TaxID=2487335 RepID=UPI0020CF2607|nr:50S ribosomal protein L18 [Lacihabitans sp. LS3-19]MCP9766998.1 50S ribosomal protein L18 [Lacihabitans sp. LS3-19]